jgi:phage I-like protein
MAARRLQELAQMAFEQLLLEPHLGEDELRLVLRRVEEEEARLDALQHAGPAAALDAVQLERAQLRQDSAKLERVAEILEQRAHQFAELDARNRELTEHADAMERHLSELRAQQAGLRGLEEAMDDRVTNHLLGICNRMPAQQYVAPLDVVARQDDRDYFVSQSDATGQVLCEMLIPKEWVAL